MHQLGLRPVRLLPLPPERLLELPSERLLVLPPDCLLARHRVALLASIQKASTARPLHEPARAGIVPLMLTSPARPGSRLAMLPLKALWLCQPISKEAFWAHWLQGLEERPTRVPRDAQVEVAAREPFATAYGRHSVARTPELVGPGGSEGDLTRTSSSTFWLVNLNRRDAVSTLARYESRWAFHRIIGQQIQERTQPRHTVSVEKVGHSKVDLKSGLDFES